MHSFGDNSLALRDIWWKNGMGALEDGNRLNRYAYGEGERQQEVWVRGLCEKEIPVEISLGEREYAEEDVKKALLEAGGKLADLIRGNNLSLQEVREDLHLVGWLEEEGIRVRWTPGGCGMDSDGWDSFK